MGFVEELGSCSWNQTYQYNLNHCANDNGDGGTADQRVGITVFFFFFINIFIALIMVPMREMRQAKSHQQKQRYPMLMIVGWLACRVWLVGWLVKEINGSSESMRV